MRKINKKKVLITIIFVVIIIGIIICLVIYNSGRQEDISIQREEQNINTENLLTGSVENSMEDNNVSIKRNLQIQGDEEEVANERIKLTVNGNEEILANLEDNVASREFLEMLPLTLTFEDFNNTEKIANIPSKLNVDGLPSGYTPSIGDLAYYAPWGNISVFYEDFRYSNSLYKLGTLESGTEIFADINNDFEVTIERVN